MGQLEGESLDCDGLFYGDFEKKKRLPRFGRHPLRPRRGGERGGNQKTGTPIKELKKSTEGLVICVKNGRVPTQDSNGSGG